MVEVQGISGYQDPLNTAQYVLDCGSSDESLVFGFNSFTGPKMVREVLDWFPGGTTSSWTRKIPAGKLNCEPITIVKAIVPADQLDNLRAWANLCMPPGAGKGYMSQNFRRPVKLMAKDNSGAVQRSVTLFDCWISSIKALPDFAGDKPEIVVEEVEIQWEGWDLGGVAGAPTLPFASPI